MLALLCDGDCFSVVTVLWWLLYSDDCTVQWWLICYGDCTLHCWLYLALVTVLYGDSTALAVLCGGDFFCSDCTLQWWLCFGDCFTMMAVLCNGDWFAMVTVLCSGDYTLATLGSGCSSVVRAPDSWLKDRGFKSLLEQLDNFLLQDKLSVLTLILVSIPPRVTAVARKRPRSFCQKCRLQVTAKTRVHLTYTLWLCMKWHGAWLYSVHRTRWDGSSFMWHQPCQHCKYTTSVDIQKRAVKSYSLM